MTRFFISYARKDADKLAELLDRRLTECGYDVWRDKSDMELAVNFPQALSEEIEKSTDAIVIVSPAALQSTWVMDEVNMAMAAHKRIWPIMLDGVDTKSIPLFLRKINGQPFKGLDDWQALHQLVNKFEGGKDIPRVYNMTGYSEVTAKGVLVLGNASFSRADILSPDDIQKRAIALAKEAIPYLKAGAGIAPPGLPSLAISVIAFLLGALNGMPRLYYTYRDGEKYFLSADKFIVLQDLRETGVLFREQS